MEILRGIAAESESPRSGAQLSARRTSPRWSTNLGSPICSRDEEWFGRPSACTDSRISACRPVRHALHADAEEILLVTLMRGDTRFGRSSGSCSSSYSNNCSKCFMVQLFLVRLARVKIRSGIIGRTWRVEELRLHSLLIRDSVFARVSDYRSWVSLQINRFPELSRRWTLR